MGRTQRRSRSALAATAIVGMVGGSLALMGTAHAAVMLSGSTIDAAGNAVDGFLFVDAVEPTGTSHSVYVENGSFDVPVDDGTYKLYFSPADGEYASEYYRDKVDYATADVVTVAGAGQVLAPWTIDFAPFVGGVVKTADGRPVVNGQVVARDLDGFLVDSDLTDRAGLFRIGHDEPVKVSFSGEDPDTGKILATEWYSDKGSFAAADVVTPTATGTDLGVVNLAPGGSIGGRVANEAGVPLHRVEVCTDDACDYTDPNGYYLIEGVQTGDHEVLFSDRQIGEYADEYWNNVPATFGADGTPVTVAPGQAVAGIDAVLTALPVVAPNGVDLSGTVRDELGGVGVGYRIEAHTTPADERDSEVVATTYSNRAGKYYFAELDRIGGETEFKIEVVGDEPREDGDFARRTIWSGDRLGEGTAVPVTAAPRVLDFVQPVAGGVAGAVTSDAGFVPANPYVIFRDEELDSGFANEFGIDGSYDERTLWAGTYTVEFGAFDHAPEWWKDALPEDATTITVKPGQVVTGISASLARDVMAIERPEVKGDAWVGKTIRLEKGRWNAEGGSKFTYEWLVGSTVIATGPSLKIAKSHLGKKITGRVTNDAGFSIGQATTATTPKVGYKPKLKAAVSKKAITLKLKVKPLKAKKVKASVVVYKIMGLKANGEQKLKKIGKGKITKGQGVIRLKKALARGKHKLLFRIKGKGKVGSGDLIQKVKIKR